MSKFAACAQVVRASVVALLGVAALIGFSSPLPAAAAAAGEVEEEAEADEEEVELEEVAVTGTRIAAAAGLAAFLVGSELVKAAEIGFLVDLGAAHFAAAVHQEY